MAKTSSKTSRGRAKPLDEMTGNTATEDTAAEDTTTKIDESSSKPTGRKPASKLPPSPVDVKAQDEATAAAIAGPNSDTTDKNKQRPAAPLTRKPVAQETSRFAHLDQQLRRGRLPAEGAAMTLHQIGQAKNYGTRVA